MSVPKSISASANHRPIIIGRDGAAMLALSLAIMVMSGGVSYAAALALVWRIAHRTSTCVAGAASRALVLCQRLDPSGEPSLLFQARLDRACILAAQSPRLELVVLGGHTSDGLVSEAEAGRRYLAARGIAPDRILLEDGSRHTLENLANYRARLATETEAPPLLITSRFHLARSSLLAAGLGISHTPCAAEDRWTLALRPLLMEALLIHWYITGREFARWTGNRRMAARIS